MFHIVPLKCQGWTGIDPVVDKHTTYLRIEKKTGVVIDVAKKIQGWIDRRWSNTYSISDDSI